MSVRTQSSIWIDEGLEVEAGEAVLESLPLSFARAGNRAAAEVVVVDGRSRRWSHELASLAEGQVAVLVDPWVDGATPDGRPFVLDTPWGSNAACAAASDAFGAASWQRLECRAVVAAGADLDRALLRLVCLLRSVDVALDQLRVLAVNAGGLTAVARSGEHLVDLDLTCTDGVRSHALLRALTDDGDVTVVIPEPATAQPAELTLTDAAGSRLLPTTWESAHRTTWRRLRENPSLDDSVAFAKDAELVVGALAGKESGR